MSTNVLKLIEAVLACSTMLLLSGMGFLTMLIGIALDRPENLSKLLTIIKEYFNGFNRD